MKLFDSLKKAARVGGASLAWLGLACSKLVGDYEVAEAPEHNEPSDAAAPTLTTQCGSFAYGAEGAGCRDCVDANCCDEAQACSKDPTCREYTQCLAACAPSDVPCRSICTASIPHAIEKAEVIRLEGCQTQHCDASCGVPCGGLDSPSPACEAHLRRGCCDEQRAIVLDHDAVEWAACQEHCGFVKSCRAVCDLQHVAGTQKWEAVFTCYETHGFFENAACSEPVWSCLGRVRWPKTSPFVQAIDLHVQTVDAVHNTPLPGLTVTACPQGVAPCDPAANDGGWTFPSGKTDDQGIATLSRIESGTFFGFPEYLDIRGATIPETLTYFDRPPLLDSIWMGTQVVTSTDLDATLLAHNITRLPDRGNVWVIVRDCYSNSSIVWNVGGVIVDSPQKKHDSIVLQDLNDPLATETRSQGLTVLLNMPAGLTEIEGRLVKTGQLTARRQVWVRAGAVTILVLSPTPTAP